MLFHEFGTEYEKTVVMLHGLAMSWDMMEESIRKLVEHAHVIAVAVPGMDMDAANEFTSVENIAALIEDQLLDAGAREIDCLYGLSMGGGIVIRMLADRKLDIRHAVIDAGITPYELPYLVTRLILLKDVSMTLLGKLSEQMMAFAFPPEAYTEKAVHRMYEVMRHMTVRTIWRAYDSTDNYTMPDVFPKLDTDIWYWYGEKEQKERRLDLRYVKKHIPGARFRKVPEMSHGQYILSQPEKFVKDMEKLLDLE